MWLFIKVHEFKKKYICYECDVCNCAKIKKYNKPGFTSVSETKFFFFFFFFIDGTNNAHDDRLQSGVHQTGGGVEIVIPNLTSTTTTTTTDAPSTSRGQHPEVNIPSTSRGHQPEVNIPITSRGHHPEVNIPSTSRGHHPEVNIPSFGMVTSRCDRYVDFGLVTSRCARYVDTSRGHQPNVDAPSTSRGHHPDRNTPSTSRGHSGKRPHHNVDILSDDDDDDDDDNNDHVPMYHVNRVSQRHIRKYNANLTDYSVSFRPVENQGAMLNMIPRVRGMLGDIVDDVLTGARPRDMVRVVVNAPQLDKPIQLPFVRRDQFDRDMLGLRIESVLQSHQEISLDENLELNVLHMVMPEGGSRRRKYLENAERLAKKICFIRIVDNNNEKICCARAIVTGIARVENEPNWNSIRQSKGKQRILAHQLRIAADVPIGPCGLDEIKKFESTPQMANFRVVVLSKEHCDHIIYTGPDERDHTIYLYNHDEHYDLITKMTAFMERAYFCSTCMVGYDTRFTHKCEYTCKLCLGKDCRPVASNECYVSCDKCNRSFKSQTCLSNHIKNEICDKKFKCEKCGILCNRKLLNYHKKKHVCGEIYCSVCRDFDSLDHKYFMQKSVIQTEYDDNGKLCDLDEPYKFIFFDFECTQNTGEHVPNYCIAQKACSECHERPLESECLICGEEKQKVFKGENTGDEFCRWLFGEASNRGSTVIAHNFKSYDGIFIQKYLYENCIIPKMILAGGKIMSMEVAFNMIRFVDSQNFLPMPLSAMPKTFGIDEVKKGFFPHFFNTEENSDYNGPMPAKENYNPNGMSSNQREEFLSWYDNEVALDKQFIMAEEIHAYCLSDVDILRRCCMRFRSLFIDITKRSPDDVGIDPFSRCITIASACQFVYRRNFMPSYTIGLLPPSGYDPKDIQSKGAIEWLQYVERTQNIYIRHARNEGEMKIGKYKVDGYCKEKKIIFEYNGCYFHGCPVCYHSDAKNRKRDGQLMVELYHATLAKKKYIESILPDYTYVTMWEHDWSLIKQTLPPSDVQGTPILNLDPRDAFYGGRTNASRLFYECENDEQIKYVDFTSLYPFVNKYGSHPIGHPIVITENFADDISEYYGLIKCKVLPPQNLIHPVLPVKVNGKMTFPLCHACVESLQTESCAHTEQERALHSTWVSLELETAIEKGYKILEIEAVWHFNREIQYDKSLDGNSSFAQSCNGLFTKYIDTFLKIKQEASGWPEWCKTTADKRK